MKYLGEAKKGTVLFFKGDVIPLGYKHLKRLGRFAPPPWSNPSVPPPPDGLTCDDLGIKVLVKK